MRAAGRRYWGATACAALLIGCSQSSKDDEPSVSGSGGQVANGGTGGSTGSGGAGGAATGGQDGTDGSGGRGAANSGSGGMNPADAGSGGIASPASDGGRARDAGTRDAGTREILPFKGVANSPCAARESLQASWYYNWGQTETEPCNGGGGGEFVPMIWGHGGDEQSASSIASAVASFADKGQGYVLGFNEPDNPGQSNIPVDTAISLWPAFDNPAIKVASPGTAANANPGQAWFTDFMMQLNADPDLRADVLAIHWYGWNAGSCDANASGLESYIAWAENFAGGRPIWITEWGCLNQSAPDEDTVVKFYSGALAVFARHPRVERYAWYPWATNCHLVDDNGELTALGKVYAAAPAYR